jgi:hypothetical protein
MESRPELEHKILKDIGKTGYPLEIRASLVLEAQDWIVTHNPTYVDVEERKAREVDINAVRAWRAQMPGPVPHILLCSLFLECKKSDKPWVFFMTPVSQAERARHDLRYYSAIANLVEGSSSTRDCVLDVDFLQSSYPHFRLESRARTYYQPFKGREKAEKPQAIFGALSTATKAVLDEAARFQRITGEHEAFEWLTLFWYPVVIFSGPMYEATVPLTGDIQLAQSSHVQVAFSHIPKGAHPGADPDRFVVDVVHQSYFAEYVSDQAGFHSAVAAKLENCYKEGTVRVRAKQPSKPEGKK